MAQNKECLIFILDVRDTANADFKLQSVKCAAEILKDKICSGKKDVINFILVGTQRTQNLLNENASGIGYANIFQYPQAKEASWQLLMDYYKFVNEPACSWGDWLDSVTVAMEIMKDADVTPLKYKRARILLFYDFNGMQNSYDEFDNVTSNLLKDEINLIVVSPNICYIDNPESGKPQVIFSNVGEKDKHQIENEKYALRLIFHCNAELCNCKEALRTVFAVKNNPWTWNAKLQIGTKINLLVTGVIAIKDESNIRLKKCWGDDDETISRVAKYFHRGQELQPDEADLVDGYMLGATPVPVETIKDKSAEKSEASLKFLAFTRRDSIPSEYFYGDSLYTILHRKGYAASARKLDALVRALHNTEMVVLCWKIYSAKFNNPKLVVLLPNELCENQSASLSMVELAYHAQHHYWDFPTLATNKTACSDEQFAAIDELIDAMDLSLSPKKLTEPRDIYEKDLLPFSTLPHIYEQNVMDFLERKIIFNASQTDEQFEEMLNDKNFVEVFWNVSENIEEDSKRAAQRIKKLFPLERASIVFEQAKTPLTQPVESLKIEDSDKQSTEHSNNSEVIRINLESPADDFLKLVKDNVESQSNLTSRQKLFDLYALQIRSILWKLLFETMPIDMEKIKKALAIYRQCCVKMHCLDDYNNWMHELKAEVLQKKLFDFWQDVIVGEKLGIIELDVTELTLEEQLILDAFYKIEKN